MAAPQLQEILVNDTGAVLLTFDQPLDTAVNTPKTCFSINYGQVIIDDYTFKGSSQIELTLTTEIKPGDKLLVNYQPPQDVQLALRGVVPANPATVTIRRNAVRSFFKVPAKIQLKPNEDSWDAMSNLGSEETAAYPINARPADPRAATPDDYILAYGLKEAIQISNLDDADAIQPNTDRIWMAIQDAAALIDNYIIQASRAGKVLISSNRRRTTLILARYYLDSVRRREDIKEDYERALETLDKASKLEDVVRPDPPWWQVTGCGVRSFRTPQRYNGVSGKGFSGWWNDSGRAHVSDWRYDTYNSENNNDENNWRDTTDPNEAPRWPEQPADDGGNNTGTNSGSAP